MFNQRMSPISMFFPGGQQNMSQGLIRLLSSLDPYKSNSQIGETAGGLGGGLIGSIFGPIGSAVGKEAGRDVGGGIEDLIKGEDFGKVLLKRLLLNPLKSGASMMNPMTALSKLGGSFLGMFT